MSYHAYWNDESNISFFDLGLSMEIFIRNEWLFFKMSESKSEVLNVIYCYLYGDLYGSSLRYFV